MVTSVNLGATFDAGTPTALFQANPREMNATSEQANYDVTKDGQRFLINTQLKAGTMSMSVVLNWTQKLKTETTIGPAKVVFMPKLREAGKNDC